MYHFTSFPRNWPVESLIPKAWKETQGNFGLRRESPDFAWKKVLDLQWASPTGKKENQKEIAEQRYRKYTVQYTEFLSRAILFVATDELAGSDHTGQRFDWTCTKGDQHCDEKIRKELKLF